MLAGRAVVKASRTRMTRKASQQPSGTGTAPVPEEQFTEKAFYLHAFRDHTLLVAARSDQLATSGDLEALAAVARDLLQNRTRLLVLADAPAPERARHTLDFLRQRLGPLMFQGETIPLFPHLRNAARRSEVFLLLDALQRELRPSVLAEIWKVLGSHQVLVGVVPCGPGQLAACAQRLATALRVYKLVLVEAEGGIVDRSGRALSFMDAAMLDALLAAGEAEAAGLGHRRPTLAAVRAALLGGVSAVNLCALAGLERELFTYEGAGTLFTREDYCRVERLGIDDFAEVERLIERGQREGLLKMRTGDEVAQILACGYGATIGEHHLAGVCGLLTEPYADERAGEIVALYTITRFKGEGVAQKLLARIEKDARAQGLRYLFACTTEERAKAFFERCGFRRVSQDQVPPAKWTGYDAARRSAVAAFRLDLERGKNAAASQPEARGAPSRP